MKQSMVGRALAVAALAISLLLASCSKTQQSSVQMLPTPVQVNHLESKTVRKTLSLNGTLMADKDVVVKAETQGRVVKADMQWGQRVPQGAVLVQVDDVIKLATYQANQAAVVKLGKDLERTLALRDQKVTSDADLDNAKLALAQATAQETISQKDWENTRIRAPFAGVVTETQVSQGDMVSPGTPVVRLVDRDHLKVVVNVSENDIAQVKIGDPVKILDLEAIAVPGVVTALSPRATDARTYPVEVRPQVRTDRFLVGRSVQVVMTTTPKSIHAIPRTALLGSVEAPQVYVVQDGRAVVRDLTVGGEYGVDLEVLGGLGPDDPVVVNGQNNLVAGAAVSIQGQP